MFTSFSFLSRAVAGTALLASVGTLVASRSDVPAPRRVYGAPLTLGDGAARTFVTLDAAGRPATLGVALSERALNGLPQTPMHGGPSAAMLILPLPAAARATGFDHVMLDWNPAGHEPEHVYTQPHFDFHFYNITSAERESIDPKNPEWAAKVAAFPAAEYVPNGYAAASNLAGAPPTAVGVPLMGMHWLDVASPELQPPPNGKTFTSTFIYGTWDSRFIFVEPMITRAHLMSVKTIPSGLTYQVGQSAKVTTPGMYPTSYSISFDATAREYRVPLEGLRAR